ncbi:hypothetical protein P4233_01715 [Pseudomonas aeruginosa]|nr:hypothetical protein [Pseudomonas aeruginosa]
MAATSAGLFRRWPPACCRRPARHAGPGRDLEALERPDRMDAVIVAGIVPGLPVGRAP